MTYPDDVPSSPSYQDANAPNPDELTSAHAHGRFVRLTSFSLWNENARLQRRLHTLERAHLRAAQRYNEAPVGLLNLDQEGRILEANQRACALLGTGREGLIGQQLLYHTIDGSQSTFKAVLRQAAHRHEPHLLKLALAGSPGESFQTCFKVTKSQGVLGQVQLSITELAGQPEANDALWLQNARLEQQVQTLSVRLRQQTEEFQQVVQAMGTYVQSSVRRSASFLKLLRQELPGGASDAHRHTEHASLALIQASGLIDALLNYDQASHTTIYLREVDLNAVLHEVRKDLTSAMHGRQVNLTNDPLPVVQGDSLVLQTIMTHLLSNALKFTKTREIAEIRILVRESAAEVHIGVQDNGVGFSSQQRAYLFDLFRRLHASGRFDGTGMGLATVRRLCRRFGGRVWGEGSLNRGATIWFAWPKAPVLFDEVAASSGREGESILCLTPDVPF